MFTSGFITELLLILAFPALFLLMLYFMGLITRNIHIRYRINSAPIQHTISQKRSKLNENKKFSNRIFGDLFRLLSNTRQKSIKNALDQAGFRQKSSYNNYLLVQIFLPIVAGIATTVLTILLQPYLPPMTRILTASSGVLLGMITPNLYLQMAAAKYRKKICSSLVSVLDLMVICIEAGYSNDNTLKRIAGELKTLSPEVSYEFEKTITELKMLPSRDQAWRNLVVRVKSNELDAVIQALQQNEQFGTPIANTLKTLVATFRKERLAKIETKAAKLPVFLTLPLILFIFPTIFIILIGPVAIDVTERFF